MPSLNSIAPVRASLVLAFAGCTAALAFAQTQAPIFQDEYGLRSTIVPKGKAAAAGSPPGFGAGESGYVSASRPKTGTRRATSKAKPKSASAEPEPAAADPARRVRRAIDDEGEETGGAPRPRLRRTHDQDDPYAPVGFRAGSFDVKPSAEISGGYDDNPFRTAARRGSRFAKYVAKVETKSNWSCHELAGELRGAFTDYLQVPGNDRPEAEAKLRGRIDVTSASRVELEGRAALTTEAAGSPDSVASAKRPPNVYTLAGAAAFVQRFNRLELGLRGTVERNTYQDAELIGGGSQDLSDRDYTSYGLALRGSYEVTPGIRPFLEAGVDRRVFDRGIDFSGVRRGSDGVRAVAGLKFEREGILTGEASAGFAHRRYEDPSLSDVSGLIVDSSLVWKASALTTVTLKAKSEIGETTLPGASGVFNREAGIAIDHAFRRWLIGSASITYGVEDYRGAGRRDDRLTLAAGLTYHLNRYAALKGEVRREQLRSDVPGNDYTASIATLGLRLQR